MYTIYICLMYIYICVCVVCMYVLIYLDPRVPVKIVF
jgi:hypothetical protein